MFPLFSMKKLNICIQSIFLCNLTYKESKSLNFVITEFLTGKEFLILSTVETNLMISIIINHLPSRQENLVLKKVVTFPKFSRLDLLFDCVSYLRTKSKVFTF